LARLPDQLVGQQRGRGGRDRAALALERDLGDPAVAVEPDRHVLLVAAEGVVVLVLEGGLLEPPEVVRALGVLGGLLAVKLGHCFEASGATGGAQEMSLTTISTRPGTPAKRRIRRRAFSRRLRVIVARYPASSGSPSMRISYSPNTRRASSRPSTRRSISS